MRRIRSNYVLQVHKVTSAEVVHNFINDSWFLCHVATWTSHVATTFLTLSATSRRGFTRRDVKFICLCHVATWNSNVATWTNTSRRQKYMSLSRRDVEFPRPDVTFTLHCYVATSIYTSRHGLVQVSVTSRRGPERRDVVWSCALSRRDVDLNVATLACLLSVTSQRGPVLNPRSVHFWFFTSQTPYRNPSFPWAPAFTGPVGALIHTGRRPFHCSPTAIVLLRATLFPWYRAIVAFPHCAWF